MSAIRVPIVRGRSRVEIEKLALQFLLRHEKERLTDPRPVPMLQFFDRVLPASYGFSAEVDDLPAGLEGRTDPTERTVTLPPKVYEGLEDDEPRPRFTTGHEIGHVILHTDELAATGTRLPNSKEQSVVLARRKEIPAYADPEWQADVFAAALLMPISAITQLDRMGILSVHRIVETFCVSTTSAGKRLRIYRDNSDLRAIGEKILTLSGM